MTMQELFDFIGSIFNLFENTHFLGMSVTTWFVIALVLSAVGIFVKGNK